MNKPYQIRVREFVTKVTNMRLHLIKNNQSKLPGVNVYDQIKDIKSKLDYFHGATGLYRLLINYNDRIRQLIPGKESSSHDKLINELDQLINEGANLI